MPRSPTLPELRFVVVGAEATGKSTFIRHALDLKKPLTLPVASKKMSLEGDVFMIRLMEVALGDVNVDDDYAVTWPYARDAADQRIDGVLALYDVSRRVTLAGVPDLLNACAKSNLPCVLVAAKCDLPASERKIDPREVEKSCMRETGIEGCQTHLERPESHKRCISIVLRNVISNNKLVPEGNSRSRAMTAGTLSSQTRDKEDQAQRPSHARAVSELTVRSIKSPTTAGELERIISFGDNHTSAFSTGPVPGYEEPALTAFPIAMDEREVESDPETPQPTVSGNKGESDEANLDGTAIGTRPRSRLRPGAPITIANSLIDGENDLASESDEGEEAPPVPRKPSPPPDPVAAKGQSFNDLVDRLVSLSLTREDASFNEAFLCLYRKFAAPAQLLAALYDRWEALQENDEPPILTLQSQLRIVAMLARWITEYPGDCAHPLTRHYLTQVCERLSEDRIFAAAARDIIDSIEQQSPDEDLLWSVSDSELGDEVIKELFPGLPEIKDPTRSADTAGWFESNEESYLKDDSDGDSIGHRRNASSASGWSGERSASFSVGSLSTVLDSIEAAKAQAELLIPLSRAPLTKLQWRQFMEYSDDDLAGELTRMDWIMYSALQPRELVRHVSLPQAEKEKTRSLDHLIRMINHFNHIGYWTTNMILLRDKPKHRAKALEKFIDVARKLRLQNNYNSLAAIIAGINGTSIHRLAQTRELIPQNVAKEFMTLEILMGTRKGYFAYRLAWENTVGEKVPFLPLHLRDLIATEEGVPTFVNKDKERINWRKFEIMGETVVSIKQSQGNPYPTIARNTEMQRLILDGRISMDDEELYERSVQIEPRGPNEPRRKFALFQRG